MSEINLTTELANETVKTVTATGGLGMLGINLKIFIAQLVNFIVVLLVLWKWVYTPLVKLLDDRASRIEKSMKQTQEIEERLAQSEQEQKKLIVQARTEAASVLEQARAEAEKRKKDLIDSAKQEVQRVVVQGKEQLQAEKVTMIKGAKSEIVEIAISAAEKILKESIDQKSSQKFAKEVVDKIDQV